MRVPRHRPLGALIGPCLVALAALAAIPACHERNVKENEGTPQTAERSSPSLTPAALDTNPAASDGTRTESAGGGPGAYSRVEGMGGLTGEPPPVIVEAMLDKVRLTAGEVLTLILSIDRAAGVQVKLPEFKKYGRFDVMSVIESEAPGEGGRVVLIRTYRLQAFTVGAYRLPGIPLQYTDAHGRWHQTRTDRFHIWVASVIPPGSEPEDVLDIKDLFPFVWKFLEWLFLLILSGALAVLLSAVLTYMVFRRRRRARSAAGPKLAHDLAFEELERLQREGLVARGQVVRHYTILHRIFRRYLERRFGLGCMERTSEEILVGLQGMRYFGQHTFEVTSRFFEEADRVKFAAHTPSATEMEDTLKGIYYFIELTRERPVAGIRVEADEPQAEAA